MSEMNRFEWEFFYKELAEKLLFYKNNRKELIVKVKEIYEKANLNLPNLEKDNQIIDIDPFTIFGFFNKNITESNRLSILNAIAELFDIKVTVPTIFDGVPFLDPRNSLFYSFRDEREDNDIQDVWILFERALDYIKNQSDLNKGRLKEYFDIVINKKGIGNSKLTMGLFWIGPDVFINLDQRNIWYIYEAEKFPSNFIKSLPTIEGKLSADDYFDIILNVKLYLKNDESIYKSFKELSSEAILRQ